MLLSIDDGSIRNEGCGLLSKEKSVEGCDARKAS
jgi:hypothetical protein